MKTPIRTLTAGTFFILLSGINLARAQAPASVSGTTLFQTATAAAAPFDYPNYGLVFIADTGDKFSSGGVMDGSVTDPGTGTYSYVQSGADGLFTITNHAGRFTSDYTFNDSVSGTYVLNQRSSSGFQDGTFILYAGQAPSSLAGITLNGQGTDGANEGASFPEYIGLAFSAGKVSTSGGAGNGVKPYTYSLINRSTGRVVINNEKNNEVYLFFNSPTAGGFAQNDQFGGWTVGTFTISNSSAPTLAITNPTKTEKNWSNAVFTVSGKCGDNLVISNVLVSLNGGLQIPATLLNNNRNWTEQVTLTPGPNTISAYAVDINGNVSATNTVEFDYILSGRLTVQVVGSGTVTPDGNGTLLAIGSSYTIKAVPAKGFGFYYWSGGVTMSAKPSLTFTMSSNLAIIANFKDIMPPKLTITTPVTNQKWSNSVISVSGKAADNVSVTAVLVQINNGGWQLASSGNDFTNWAASDLPVMSGENIVQAIAEDASGNTSKTNTVKFYGKLHPASLSGYEAKVTMTGMTQMLDLSWGESTWAQAGIGNDTNADDYATGDYTYLQTGQDTAVLTNIDIGMMRALGTTNVTTVNLTFTGPTSADFGWTNDSSSGTGTMTFSQVNNLVPGSLAGKKLHLGGSDGPTLTFGNDGTFNRTQGAKSSSGTFTLFQYSPTVGVIMQNYTDVDEAGALGFIELNFTSATAGTGYGCYYGNPVYGINPDDSGEGNFTLK